MSGSEEDAIGSAPTQLTLSGNVDLEATSELASGSEIGRYRLVSRIGAGAMGEVWAATDPQLQRDVAIKLVHPHLARDPEISARLLREARAMAQVSHRAVIAIHDAGEADGRLFLAMELVRGRTLGALLRQRREPGDWRRWLEMMIEAGRGLAAAHAAGVLHRDFKPDNVMVDDRGRVCVGDFGLASLGDGPRSANRTSRAVLDRDRDGDLTMTGALLGTPAYMSLEQIHGEAVDARADQFSFCVATHEALYGIRPFAGDTAEPTSIGALGDAIAAGRILLPPAGTDVPAAIRAIVVRGLAKLPADRWPDLDAMLAALEHKLRVPRWPGFAGAGALAVAAVAIAIAIVARRTTAPVATAHELSSIPLRAALAMSSNGRLAIAAERIEVRDLANGRMWSMKPSSLDRIWIDHVQFVENDLVVRWTDHRNPGLTWRWAYTTAAAAVPEHDLGGEWLGTVDEGELLIGPGATIDLTKAGQVVRSWPPEPSHLDEFTISPAHHRFAYLMTDRFAGNLVAGDAATGQLWRSPPLVEPSGLGWLTDDTLVYGTADGSIFEVTLGDAGFSAPRRVYHLAVGWPGRMFVVAGRVRFVSHVPTTRVRLIDRDTGSVRDFEPSIAAAELGWISNDAFVTWDRATHALVRVGASALDSIPMTLPSEPANATFAGDLVLAALRDVGGRKLVAVSITTGATAWEHPVGTSLAARCAADLAPPCFVARRTKEPTERYAVLALDPRTGGTSGSPVYVGPLEDIAVREDGKRLLIADGTSKVREVDLTGEVTATFDHASSTVRTVAYDPRGGVITNALFGNSYAVAHQDAAAMTVLTQSDGELLSMVRPARTTGQILVLGRTIASALWELELPP